MNCQPKAVSALGQDGMGNTSEVLINVVNPDKPKKADRLEPKLALRARRIPPDEKPFDSDALTSHVSGIVESPYSKNKTFRTLVPMRR